MNRTLFLDANSHTSPKFSGLRPHRYKALFALPLLVFGLGSLQLQVCRNKGSTSVTGVIYSPPEALVSSGPSLLDVHDGGAITDSFLGELSLCQLGSLPEGGELRTE